MKKEDFRGKKVTVMGTGLDSSGVATVRFLAAAGAQVIATDMKSEKDMKVSLEKLKDLKNVKFVLGQHRMEDFTNVDMVVKGPAVPWNSKHIQAALKHKIPVEMDSSLFFKLCKLPVIGVTGTKGKTTTATLVAEILATSGEKVFTAGIDQKPVLSVLNETEKAKKGAVVFELSSSRLSALGREGLSPRIAVITNIFPDHLHYYGTMEKYIADKKYIFSNQRPDDFVVLNYDNEVVRNLSDEAKSKIIFFSGGEADCENCVFVKRGKIIYKTGAEKKEICDLADIKLRGGHNIGNILAATAAALAYGVLSGKICEAIQNFKGVPHRLEFVRERNGVKYYNDTAATMPDAAIAGINSFSEPIILIAGGANKNMDFKEFAKAISEKIKKVILLKGEATEKIKKELRSLASSVEAKLPLIDSEFDSMEKAVIRAKSISGPGDIVLLSPGAAGLGFFLNEFDRGEKFREAVGRL